MKLAGVKVIELSLFLPGPHLTMMMADHGADVIKVEPYEGGEPVRHIGPQEDGETVYFRNTHRGKRSLRLNLKHAEGREILMRLAERADVLVESFRPGVVDRLGVGYAPVSARAPQLVYCSISAFGQSGAYRDRPAHDLAVEALAGLVSVNLDQEDRPAMPAVPASDMAASLMALSGILMALLKQRATGQGDYLDIAMHDSLLAWTANVMGPVFAEGRAPVAKQERTWGGERLLQPLRDEGRRVARARRLRAQVRRELPRQGRAVGPRALRAQAARRAGAADRVSARSSSGRRRSPSGWRGWTASTSRTRRCARSKEAIDDPNTRARGMLLVDERGRQHLGVPIKFAREPAQPVLRAPGFGEHSIEIVKSLGYDDAKIDQLRAERVIG